MVVLRFTAIALDVVLDFGFFGEEDWRFEEVGRSFCSSIFGDMAGFFNVEIEKTKH